MSTPNAVLLLANLSAPGCISNGRCHTTERQQNPKELDLFRLIVVFLLRRRLLLQALHIRRDRAMMATNLQAKTRRVMARTLRYEYWGSAPQLSTSFGPCAYSHIKIVVLFLGQPGMIVVSWNTAARLT